MDPDRSSNQPGPVAATHPTPTPRKLSDLLSAFAASPSPTSTSNLRRQMQSRIDLTNMATSEAEAINTSLPPSPAPVQTAIVANREEHSDNEDELHDDDVIHGTHSVVLVREISPLTIMISCAEDERGKPSESPLATPCSQANCQSSHSTTPSALGQASHELCAGNGQCKETKIFW
jgi:hypothetical protein